MLHTTAGMVPQDVVGGLVAVCDSDRLNMCHYGEVAKLAEELGFRDTAEWIRDKGNRAVYAAWVWARS